MSALSISKRIALAVLALALLAAALGPAASPTLGGELAYVKGGVLHIRLASGATYALGAGIDPKWSEDGAYVAYLVPANGQTLSGDLRIVTAATGALTTIDGLGDVDAGEFAWSPTADRLAAALPAGKSGMGGGLDVITAQGVATRLGRAAGPTLGGVFWSPNGASVLLSHLTPSDASAPAKAALETVNARTGEVQVLVTASQGLLPAGWWANGGGILYWVDPLFSASIAADGLELMSLDLSHGRQRPKELLTTLPYVPWIVPETGSKVAVVAGRSRDSTISKQVEVCAAKAGRCQTLGREPGTITVDPAYGPGGRLAFIRAQAAGLWFGPKAGASPAAALAGWMKGRSLWLTGVGKSPSARVAGTEGAFAPLWVNGGRAVLLVDDGNLELLIVATGKSSVVVRDFGAGSLVRTDGYYGYVDWPLYVAYHAGTP